MRIGSIALTSPLVVAPMAGMTDTAFRRLVKRHGGCGLVVTEMVSSEGLVRGIDRTLEYADTPKRNDRCRFRSSAAIQSRWQTPHRSSKAWAPTSST